MNPARGSDIPFNSIFAAWTPEAPQSGGTTVQGVWTKATSLARSLGDHAETVELALTLAWAITPLVACIVVLSL
jgi:hypothetical protein